ncbi:MAG: fibronectin type III domain-containing protein [Phycisphaerae bacterium]|nr:fibronectin type III domain-containing protein [Phycisphaerae bacterium]
MKFPTNQSDVVVLANSMNSGLAAHPTDFPNVNAAALATAQSEYLAACAEVETAKGTYHQKISGKKAKYNALVKIMQSGIKQATLDNIDTPDNLYLIGWAPRSAPSPMEIPGQVENFVAVTQGPGTISFKWDKPLTGGKATNYILYRRLQEQTGEFGPWTQVYNSYTNDCSLIEQPRGVQMEYSVTATNHAGNALTSNIASAVL